MGSVLCSVVARSLNMKKILATVCTLLVLLGNTSGALGASEQNVDNADPLAVVERQQKPHNIRRRSDDINILEEVVKIQSAALAELRAEVAELKAARNKTVAFTVTFSDSHVTVPKHGTFMFDVVETNIGKAFNTSTGVFTAPYGGVYAFVFNLMTDNDNNSIQAAIFRSGHLIALAHASSQASAYNKGMTHVTKHLQPGDMVYVQHRDMGRHIYGKYWTNFSGFLIHAD